MIWDTAVETLTREKMEELQLQRLRTTVNRLSTCVPPIAAKLRAAGLTSGRDVRSLDDLRALPFTTKEDLLEHYPFGLLAVPLDQVVRVHASSGTKGKPKIVGYTRADLETWSDVMARALVTAGVRPGMVAQNSYGYGLFTGGFGFHQGAERLGCTVIPIASGQTTRQVQFLRDLGAQVLFATPSYALTIADAVQAAGLAPTDLRLELGVFGAEPWTEEMRDQIEQRLGIRAMNMYGLSELIGPGVSTECAEGRKGQHVQEDHFLPEIVDINSATPQPAGTEGELVLTSLTREALPILRYRTKDVSSLSYEPCICGRTTVRMSRIRGRYDDMLIIRGVNLYPSEVERIVLSVDGLAPHYQLVVERPGAMDEISVLCEPADAQADRQALHGRLERSLRDQTGLNFQVRLVDPDQIPRSEGKAQRVIDHRVGGGASTAAGR
jgi:phenylacetate-CoA ligase